MKGKMNRIFRSGGMEFSGGQTGVWRLLLALILLGTVLLAGGCYDYKLKVGKAAFHKKYMLRKNPEALKKYDRGALRVSPVPGSKVILYLDPGTMLEPIKYSRNWYQAKTKEGRTGWIFQSDVYRVPVASAIYDRKYKSDDNHAIILTLPLIIIMLCSLFYFNNRFTRTVLLPILLILILIASVYFVGKMRARFERYNYAFRKISTFLKDKQSHIYASDFLWPNRINYFSGYTKNYSYYYCSKTPHYNRNTRIHIVTAENMNRIRGYVIVDTNFFDRMRAHAGWTLPPFYETGVYPSNWTKVMQIGGASLFVAR